MSKNSNCLEGIRCPKCGQEDRFIVEMTAAFALTDDGTEPAGDTHWDDNSPMTCDDPDCDHTGKAAEFRIENQSGQKALAFWTPRMGEFDGLELSPCHIVGKKNDGTDVVEPCTPEQADFWTVYGHYKTGGVDAFEDFDTEAQAQAFHDKLISLFPYLAEETR